MDALAEKDVQSIVQLPSDMFMRLMTCIQIVLERPVEEATYAASIVNRLVSYRFECQQLQAELNGGNSQQTSSSSSSSSASEQSIQKKQKAWQLFTQHHNQNPNVFDQILLVIFQLVCFRNCTRLWSMSRPLLPLILNNTQYFAQYKQQVLSQAPQNRQQILQHAFNKLDAQLDQTLSSKNRDLFTKNLYAAVKLIRQ